ncbi:hypothetical protein [Tengunoibacter tsumagoiensis]|uniref:Uncharacterized protein n=1 Tax=Tengunoibacter tsumagoiensis TaxID=2014871 RepID=A0A402A9R4_9CHLR|nr:hypothetical protein [Tengunoibacter tsumagoiensis]GCE15902.1 hypothetical protein KTT_57610 [Tengunoibacter tsumagoiensis]
MEFSPMQEQPVRTDTEQVLAPTARIDLITVAAIAIVAYLLGVVVHEALGHGLAALLVGLHPTRVTSVDLEVDFTHIDAWKVRAVAAAGCVANLITALIGLTLQRIIPKMSPGTRYFLWLLTTINLLIPGGYLMVLTFAGIGDWNDFIQGLPNPIIWKIGFTLLGILISLLGLRYGVRSIRPFLGADPSQRRTRAQTLTLISYFVGSLTNTLAGALNPTSPLLILISAAASSFGGTAFLLWIGGLVNKTQAGNAEVFITPTRDWIWIALGGVALIVYFFILGPGLPR